MGDAADAAAHRSPSTHGTGSAASVTALEGDRRLLRSRSPRRVGRSAESEADGSGSHLRSSGWVVQRYRPGGDALRQRLLALAAPRPPASQDPGAVHALQDPMHHLRHAFGRPRATREGVRDLAARDPGAAQPVVIGIHRAFGRPSGGVRDLATRDHGGYEGLSGGGGPSTPSSSSSSSASSSSSWGRSQNIFLPLSDETVSDSQDKEESRRVQEQSDRDEAERLANQEREQRELIQLELDRGTHLGSQLSHGPTVISIDDSSPPTTITSASEDDSSYVDSGSAGSR